MQAREIQIEIPGFEDLHIRTIFTDYTGTLSLEGELIDGVKKRLRRLAKKVDIYVIIGRRAFLVGPSAAGKSNLLDVFRFLRDLASSGGGFQQAVSRRGGVSAIRSLAARRYPDIEINAVAVGTDGSPQWDYQLAFNQDNQRRARIKKERITRDGQLLLTRPNSDDEQDPDRLSQTHLEQVNVNRPFRDLASFFESIRYLHCPATRLGARPLRRPPK
jgi:hypothetical protein